MRSSSASTIFILLDLRRLRYDRLYLPPLRGEARQQRVSGQRNEIWFAFGNFSLVREKVIIFTGSINLSEATTELTMKWAFAYGTGDKCIDDQHKALFEMSEVFRAALDEGRGERVYELLLESLDSFAHFHFGYEERCMKRCHCPAAQQNAQAHPKFIDALSGFRQRYVVGGFDRAEAQRLVDFIDQWLADHICRIDVRLKPYVQAL